MVSSPPKSCAMVPRDRYPRAFCTDNILNNKSSRRLPAKRAKQKAQLLALLADRIDLRGHAFPIRSGRRSGSNVVSRKPTTHFIGYPDPGVTHTVEVQHQTLRRVSRANWVQSMQT